MTLSHNSTILSLLFIIHYFLFNFVNAAEFCYSRYSIQTTCSHLRCLCSEHIIDFNIS